MKRRSGPPAMARWLAERALPATERECVLGDMEEKYVALCEREGARKAGLWYWRQSLLAWWPVTVLRWPARSGRGVPAITLPGLWLARHAARRLVRRPGLSVSVVVLIAGGVGSVVGITAIFMGWLYPRIGVERPAEVSWVEATDSSGSTVRAFTADALDVLSAASSQPLGSVSAAGATIRTGSDVGRGLVGYVSSGYFTILGGRPAMGRLFGDDSGAEVVVSGRFWASRLDRAPDAVGSTLLIDRRPFTVIGVTQDGFDGLESSDLWLPLNAKVGDSWRARPSLRVFTRAMRSGSGAAWLAVAESRLALAGQPLRLRLRVVTSPVSQAERDAIAFSAWVMGGLAFLVLIGACAGATNLLAADLVTRGQEMATRRALGSSPGRITALVMLENLLLAFVTVPFAAAAAAVLLHLVPSWLPVGSATTRFYTVSAGNVLLCSLLTVGSVLVASLPAIGATDPAEGLRSRSSSGLRTSRAAGIMLVIQFAQSMVLLATAGLLLHSMRTVRGLPSGFEPEGTWLFNVTLPLAEYEGGMAARFQHTLVSELAAAPSVQAVGLSRVTPVIAALPVTIRRVGEPGAAAVAARRVPASNGYFTAMGIRIERGRAWRDDTHDEAILTENLARILFPAGDAVGEEIESDDGTRLRVAGIAADGTQGGVEMARVMYLPYDFTRAGSITVVMRGRGGTALDRVARERVASLDPELATSTLGSLDDLLDRAQLLQRGMAQLATLFGLLALAICGFGIYAQVDRQARGRVREIAIRLALGATPRLASAVVWSNALRLGGIGILAGLAIAAGFGVLLSTWFFGLSRVEPVILAAGVTIVAAIAAAGTAIPTWRMLRIAPARLGQD
jgi:putative ABC transport system permease protein